MAQQALLGTLAEAVHPQARLAAHPVQEEVGRDAVQPPREVARLVRVERAEDADEHVLCEVLGIVTIAGQTVRQPVDPRGVLRDDVVPVERRGCHVICLHESIVVPAPERTHRTT
jgi:hypothetical protein